MKINQIILNEMGTVAGAVATVAKPMGETQKRPKIAGLEPAEKVMTGKAKKKGPYQNSLSEGKKKTEPVKEAKLDEDDIIVVPGQKMKRKTGFVQHGQSRVDHEVEMARSDVLATMKNAKAIYQLLKDRSEDEGIEGWVQEKLIKANDYLNAVKEYYDEKMMQEMNGGVIAGGVAFEEQEFKRGDTEKFRTDRKAGAIPPKKPGGMLDRARQRPDFEKFSTPSYKKIDEKAVSKAQQKFFGMAHAMQKGAKISGASKELKDVAKSMSKGDVKDFAKTKHKGLPQHVAKKD